MQNLLIDQETKQLAEIGQNWSKLAKIEKYPEKKRIEFRAHEAKEKINIMSSGFEA